MATVEPVTVPVDDGYELGLSTPKSAQAMETTTDTIIPDMVQEKQEILVTTTKKKENNKRLIAIISVIVLFLIASVLVAWAAFHFNFWSDSNVNNETKDSNDLLTNYVLGNDTVEITKDEDNVFKGIFTVGSSSEYEYDFVSIANATTGALVKFVTVDKRFGFSVAQTNKSTLEYVFIENGISTTLVYEQNQTDTDLVATIMEEHLGNIYSLHFVELSVKLGSIGYVGGNSSENMAVGDIHNYADWIIQITGKDDNIDVSNWPDLSEEYEKTNAIVTASKNAGHWVTTMDELIKYTSSEETPSRDSGGSSRSLLGNCISDPYCFNACFGSCGPDCTCWSWKCGDCACWLGCWEHDAYCSCEGLWTWCCVNVFWVDCSGGGLDVWYYPTCKAYWEY